MGGHGFGETVDPTACVFVGPDSWNSSTAPNPPVWPACAAARRLTVLCQRQARSDGTSESATEVYATHKAKPPVGPACAAARRRAALTAICQSRGKHSTDRAAAPIVNGGDAQRLRKKHVWERTAGPDLQFQLWGYVLSPHDDYAPRSPPRDDPPTRRPPHATQRNDSRSSATEGPQSSVCFIILKV